MKVLGPISDFSTWGFSTGTITRKSNFEGKQDLMQNFHRKGGNRDCWRVKKNPHAHQDQENETVTP